MWLILSLPYLGSSHVSWVLKTVRQENVVEWAQKSLLTDSKNSRETGIEHFTLKWSGSGRNGWEPLDEIH